MGAWRNSYQWKKVKAKYEKELEYYKQTYLNTTIFDEERGLTLVSSFDGGKSWYVTGMFKGETFDIIGPAKKILTPKTLENLEKKIQPQE